MVSRRSRVAMRAATIVWNQQPSTPTRHADPASAVTACHPAAYWSKEMTLRQCMFCTQEIEPDELTMEHPVPKGLWEKGRRPTLMKTLPAHRSCNQSFSADNEYFRDVILFEDGIERHPEAKAVQDGAISRKMKKQFGSIAKNLKGLGKRHVRTLAGIDLGIQPAYDVDWSRMERVLHNVLKGVFYISQKRPLPSDFVIFFPRPDSEVDPHWIANVESSMCPWQSFGDTVFCCRYARSSRDPIQKFACAMLFYEHRLFIGEAIDPRLLGEGGELFVPAKRQSTILVPCWAAER